MMAKAFLRRLARAQSGATAIEFALVLPVLSMMILGSIWIGLLVFTVSSLDYSVQSAARCSAVNEQLCDTTAKTVAYAEQRYTGPGATPTFTAAASDCGHSVVGEAKFDLAVVPGIKAMPLKVSACYP
ncbi:pilus assembly protein [Phenylobacterium sp. LjRoot219]|uniref:TadE/TadG family type IV pilus assembly protein n=1 Tax=Phenylobacterium sp. LjRoot219 TaxID=3342283 RepID=UPI003ECDC8B4